MPNPQNLKPVDSERAAEIGAIGGRNKKGSVHLTTHIQELLEDENFVANILDPKIGIKEYKGRPIKAIITVAMTKAVNGDLKAIDLLMKYGWNQKQEIEHTGAVATGAIDPALADDFAQFLENKTKQ